MTNQNDTYFFGKLLSVLALLAAALYFTGWTYRWAYFSFFRIDISSLQLPFESFYLVAFHVFFGNYLAIFRTILTLIITIIFFPLTLQVIHVFFLNLSHILPRSYQRIRFNSMRFLRSLVDELIIILWVLTALFILAQWQGDEDAKLDAINETSTLPTVTFISPETNAPLGRKLDDPFSNPNNFRIIGDMERYKNILTQDYSDRKKQRVWRLLHDDPGSVYIFPALSSQEISSDPNLRPPILVIYESGNGDQMMIIAPSLKE